MVTPRKQKREAALDLRGERRGLGADSLMKFAPWFVAAVSPFAVMGFGSSYIGHIAVVMLTFGIFFGTLSLGTSRVVPESVPSGADGSGDSA